jgi:predicted porin
MKKSILALATLTAFAGVASAQSSVNIGGIMDIGVSSVKNGSAGTIRGLSSGRSATSRLIFRGVEDLGGGLKANFWLESEVGVDTGSAGSTVGTSTGVFWARRSTVGLSGGFGEIRAGRENNSTFNSWNTAEIFGYVGVASPANLRGSFFGNSNGGTATAVRQSNAVTYLLPSMGGLYGQVQVSAGENVAGSQQKSASFRLGYAAGPLNINAGYGKMDKDGAMVDDLTTMNIAGTFNAGFATFGLGYEKSEYSTRDQQLVTVNATIPVGKGAFKAQYTTSSGSGAAATPDQYEAKMFGLGYVYNMSKRTSLYGSYGSINNGGNATTGANFTATTAGPAGIKRGETSSGFDFGIRHDF